MTYRPQDPQLLGRSSVIEAQDLLTTASKASNKVFSWAFLYLEVRTSAASMSPLVVTQAGTENILEAFGFAAEE